MPRGFLPLHAELGPCIATLSYESARADEKAALDQRTSARLDAWILVLASSRSEVRMMMMSIQGEQVMMMKRRRRRRASEENRKIRGQS